MKDVLTEAMDIDGLKTLLDRIATGRIKCVSVDTPVPSPFSHEILNANPYAYLDDAPLEERRARAVELRRTLPAAVPGEVGRLDQAAIDEVTSEAWPDVRDADELHDVLQTLIALPAGSNEWQSFFDGLVSAGRAAVAAHGGRRYWVAAERARTFSALFAGACFDAVLPDVEAATPTRSEAVVSVVRGWMAHAGPTTAGELADRLGVPL
jgi:ATP-dependent Lhr-like helicase